MESINIVYFYRSLISAVPIHKDSFTCKTRESTFLLWAELEMYVVVRLQILHNEVYNLFISHQDFISIPNVVSLCHLLYFTLLS